MFDFGDIRYGNTGKLIMTMKNDSTLVTTVILDLRKSAKAIGIEGLQIDRYKPTQQDDSKSQQGDTKDEGG